ncbi:MAG: methyltransferase domain-containing protein, partial [Bulleidia sp.]
MKKQGYYTTGEFAKKAHVTLRTIRWYDSKNLLKPSGYTDGGARLYTDGDLAKLQQILLFKYLGFSLDDIREMIMTSGDEEYLLGSLDIQKKLVQEKIEELNDVYRALDQTKEAIEKYHGKDLNAMLNLIHITNNDQSLKTQYLNSTNVSARIRLHSEYSVNSEGWFPWLYRKSEIHESMRILEIGCGNGALWTENLERLPESVHITLSDISEGMLRDVRKTVHNDGRFSYRCFDAKKIPFKDESFDIVFANHMLFYCDDISRVIGECKRVLKKGGKLICSTYSRRHMREITELVQEFDRDIVLSSDVLYERFGLDNGKDILSSDFDHVECYHYDDSIEISDSEPLIAYIVSCHGNQNRILIDKYREFREYVSEKVKDGFHITKDAGIFVCIK